MKRYDFWSMTAKLNAILCAIYGLFVSIIGFVIADNRFHLDPMLYVMIGIIWLLAGLNILCYYIIIKKKHHEKRIPISIRIFLACLMIGAILMTFYYPTAPVTETIHAYKENDQDT